MVNRLPHLPKEKCKLFLIDENAKPNINGEVINSYPHTEFLIGINTHPDMTFCPLYNKDAVVSSLAYEYYKMHLDKYGYNIIKGENIEKKEYPYDIACNCVIIKNKLFHTVDYTDKAILKYCAEYGIEAVNVKQGYTKCSTLIVNDNSVVTCDRKLRDIYEKNGLNALLVENKDIRLRNFDHGFIGGCGGKISEDTIGFFGDIESFCDFYKLNDFLNMCGVKFKSLIKGPLTDYGSLICLDT